MKKSTEKISPSHTYRVTNHANQHSHRTKVTMKDQGTKKPAQMLSFDEQYRQVFTPFPLPYHDIFTDADSLEQPSAQKYVPSTTMPIS